MFTIRELSNIILNDKVVGEATQIYRNTIKKMKPKDWNRETEAAALIGVLKAMELKGMLKMTIKENEHSPLPVS